MDPQTRTRLNEALVSDDPASALSSMRESGELASLPEVTALFDLGDMDGLHKDVWRHTLAVVAGVPANLEMRWSALLHDIGKSRTRRVNKGRVTFHGHDVVGAKMIDVLQRRTNIFIEPGLESTVRSLVLNHLRPAGFKGTWTDSAVRRLIADLGGLDMLDKLMCLSRADLTTKVSARRARAHAKAQELERRVLEVVTWDARPKLPKGTMGLVLERSGRSPGPWLNGVRESIEEDMFKCVVPSHLSTEEYVALALQRLVTYEK